MTKSRTPNRIKLQCVWKKNHVKMIKYVLFIVRSRCAVVDSHTPQYVKMWHCKWERKNYSYDFKSHSGRSRKRIAKTSPPAPSSSSSLVAATRPVCSSGNMLCEKQKQEKQKIMHETKGIAFIGIWKRRRTANQVYNNCNEAIIVTFTQMCQNIFVFSRYLRSTHF